jgi:parallel beta-helix repeat protein
VRLTVEPGVIWKVGSNARLNINGALYAVGTETEKVVFTSYRDDSYGGDTNGDGFSEGQPGDWRRIYYSDSVIDFLTRLEHVVVRYGGSGNEGNIYMYRSDVSIVSSEISDGSSFGIYTYEASPLIEGNVVRDNVSYGIYHYNTGSPVDRSNTITGNNHGIYVRSSTPLIEGNEITGNSGWGIYYYNAVNAPVLTGNTITGNKRGMLVPANGLPGSSAEQHQRDMDTWQREEQ